MSSLIYTIFKERLVNQQLNWMTGTIKVMLVGLGYTPETHHSYVSDLVGHEIAGAGYARQTLSGKTVTKDVEDAVMRLDADDVTFTNIDAGTFAGAVIYQQTGPDEGTPTVDVLIMYIDTPNVQTNGTDITIKFHQDGIIVF